MADLITLFCLICGDDPAQRSFSIEIPKNATIDKLRKRIKAEKTPEFDNLVADKLTLWKVNIPLDDLTTLDSTFNYKSQGVRLLPYTDIQDAFDDTTPRKSLHIVTEVPFKTKTIKVIATFEKTVHEFSWTLASRDVTLSQFKRQLHLNITFPDPINEGDLIIHHPTNSKKASKIARLDSNSELAQLVWAEDVSELSVIVTVVQQAFSWYTFPKAMQLFNLMYNSFGGLPIFHADVAEVSPEYLDTTIIELMTRYENTFPIASTNEATRKHLISSVLFNVIKHYNRQLHLSAEDEVCGTSGKGAMDFTIKDKEELIIGLAEAKKDNLNNGVGQIAVQLQASLQHNRRKRGRAPEDAESMFGVVSTGDNWLIIKVVIDGEGKTQVLVSDRLVATLPLGDVSLTADMLREPLKNVMGQIRWALDEQMKILLGLSSGSDEGEKRPRRVSPRRQASRSQSA